jgi:uncharacterized protein
VNKNFAIAIMTRPIIAGQTKTRLIARFGADAAASIHLDMLQKTIVSAKHACEHVVLFVNDEPNHSSIQNLCREHNISARLQHGDNLGSKMQQVFRDLHERHERVVLVGSDCLTHTTQRFELAANALQDHDMVFCPALDGGYVLVAAQPAVPQVFNAIDWGTNQVMAQTRAHLHQLQCRHLELEPTWDVDEPADVERAISEGYFKWLK